MFDVFISHSSADATIAFAICEFLEKAGSSVGLRREMCKEASAIARK